MNSSKSSIPWAAPIFALIILIGMFIMASFSPQAQAEKSVKHFYASYFTGDSDGMVQNVSTLWVYNHLQVKENYQDALTQRASFEEKIQLLLTFANDLALPNNQSDIQIKPTHTVIGQFSALVVFDARSSISSNLYAAVLILEDQQYRMLQIIPLEEDLLQILNYDSLIQFENTVKEYFQMSV